VSGRLTGHLDGNPLRIDATYKLLHKGGPKAASFAARLGSDTLTLDTWRSAIGGIDPAVLSNVYRMWGADLHHDKEVLAEVAHTALAGLSGSVRISEVVERLRARSAALLTATAVGTESYASLNSRRGALEGEIREIATTATEYHTADHELTSVNQRLNVITERSAELTPRATAIATLLSVTSERHREKVLSEELAELADVPAAWRPIVADLDGFRSAVETLDTTSEAARVAGDDRHRITTQVGLDTIEAEQLRVTHASVTAVQVGLTRLADRRNAVATAEDEQAEAQEATTDADTRARQALAACAEVSADLLTARPLNDTAVAPLRQALAQWATAQRQVSQCIADVSSQQARVGEVTAVRDLARSRWERFGTGMAAQQWRATPAPAMAPTSITTTPRPWPALTVAGAVALVAVLALPRWAAVAVTAVAFAGMVLALRRTRTIEITPSTPLDDTMLDDTMLDDTPLDDTMPMVANEVIAADATADAADTELRRLQGELQRRQVEAQTARDAAATEAERLGLALDTTPDLTGDLVSRAVTASTMLAELASARHAQTLADQRVERARDEVTNILEALRSTLSDAGVPERLPVEPAAAAIDTLRELTDLVAAHHMAQRAEQRARDTFEALLTPLDHEAATQPRAALLADAERFGALHQQRTVREAERDQLNHMITTRLRDQPTARALAAEGRSEAEWTAALELVQSELAELGDERDRLNERRGELATRLQQLAASDQLTSKRLELGGLIERADEQLLAGVVHLAARNLLQRAAAERRRNHQPALVERASTLLSTVAGDWQRLLVDPDSTGKQAEVTVVDSTGAELAATRLSTGARALTHLALRLATAELDAERRRVRFPIICDDPLVHLDDDRAHAVMPLLARAAHDGHQVIVFTCHGRTVDAGRAAGAQVITLG
jgi:uncharacterized protein YhaN